MAKSASSGKEEEYDNPDDQELAFGPQDTYLQGEEHDARLEEGVPLLPSRASQRRSTFSSFKEDVKQQGTRKALTQALTANQSSSELLSTSHNEKLLLYDHDSLLTYKVISHIGMSALGQRPVCLAVVYTMCLAIMAALMVFHFPNSSKFDSVKFNAFGEFLKFFIAFMLGTYVTQSFKRWLSSVTSFEKILVAIKQMTEMLHTIHCRPEWRRKVEDYCICSGYLLNVEVRTIHVSKKKQRQEIEDVFNWLTRKGLLSKEESEFLQNVQDSTPMARTRAVWSWIGEMVSEPFLEEGKTVMPPLLSRTIQLCQACIMDVELLKMNITMQMPFMYASLLSILVHMNNTILAVNGGMAVGSALNEIRRRSEQLAGERKTDRSTVSTTEQLYGAIQVAGLQIAITWIAPMLYVAFLHIAHMLCYPFGEKNYHLPTETLIARLHADLKQMDEQHTFVRSKHAEFEKIERQKQKKDKKGKKDDEEEDDDDDAGADADDGGDGA